MRKNKRMRSRMENEDGFLNSMAEDPQESAGMPGPEDWNAEEQDAGEMDQQSEARRHAEVQEFLAVFPEAARGPLPQEVWNAVCQGFSLTGAYARYQRLLQERLRASAGFGTPAWNALPAQNALPYSAGFSSPTWNALPGQNALPYSAGFGSPAWNALPGQNALPYSAGFGSSVWNSVPGQNALPFSTGSMRSAGYIYGPKDPFVDGLESDW